VLWALLLLRRFLLLIALVTKGCLDVTLQDEHLRDKAGCPLSWDKLC
jgi:hypothetical protein